jgi:acetyl esterase/lipase
VFRPAGPVRAVLHNIHGGGFCLGAPEDDDWFSDLIARRCQVAVVSTQYRLAPEHPFPAGLDDCVAGARWLAESGPALFGTDRLLVGGGSAGGYYAAQVLLWLRSSGYIGQVVAANLLFGIYDLSRTPSQRAATPETLVLNSDWMDAFHRNAFPGRADEDLRDEPYSPLYMDLTGLPPALFTVGDLDPLLDDSLFMAARWKAAGNYCELDVWPGCVHGFTNLAPKTGLIAWDRMSSWLTEQLGAAGL